MQNSTENNGENLEIYNSLVVLCQEKGLLK